MPEHGLLAVTPAKQIGLWGGNMPEHSIDGQCGCKLNLHNGVVHLYLLVLFKQKACF